MIRGALELWQSNPYGYGALFSFDDGEVSLEFLRTKVKSSAGDRLYLVSDGDSLNSIAVEAYEDDKWWWLIYLGNNQLDNPLDISEMVGKQLVIPDLRTFLAFN